MGKKREIAEINAGSMADIAFLLLIFFLVTTTMDVDKGLNRKLPAIEEEQQETEVVIKKRNIFEVVVNSNNDLLVEENYMELKDLREAAKEFIDNNGNGNCEPCQGARDPESSDEPSKAIISLSHDRGTSYEMYITVSNELSAAYDELREDLAQRTFGMSLEDALEDEARADFIKETYPQIISEAEPVNIGG